MIKRLLVALDADTDTDAATRHATEIARRHDAEVHGVAVVDTGYHDGGGGIGSMYYQEKLRGKEAAEGRSAARELMAKFERQVAAEGLRFGDLVQEGDPGARIIDDLKYFDLLVIGHQPHFVYSKPGRETQTLEEVIHQSITPVLIVENAYRPVARILVAYDGSPASASAMQRFVQLRPFGDDLTLDLVHVYERDAAASELLLRQAQAYLAAHGLKSSAVGLSGGHPDRQIVEYAAGTKADLVVLGAHSVSRLRRLAFGSTTAALLENSPIALFMDS